MKDWRAENVFGFAVLSDKVPETPPMNCPMVPEYDSDAPMVGVDVGETFNVPVPPAL